MTVISESPNFYLHRTTRTDLCLVTIIPLFLVNVCINHRINLHYYVYCPFLFCRPENTHKGKPFAIQQDLNKLYWIDDIAKVSVSKIQGKCDVVCSEDLSVSIEEYFRKGQDRFYFTEVCFYTKSLGMGYRFK